jgi:hypothetical protein
VEINLNILAVTVGKKYWHIPGGAGLHAWTDRTMTPIKLNKKTNYLCGLEFIVKIFQQYQNFPGDYRVISIMTLRPWASSTCP